MNLKSSITIISRSAKDTKKFGQRLGRFLQPGDVLLFLANLGAGKTTMVQGLVRAIGVHEAALSPTFVIAQSLKGKFPVHHLDFYRLSAEQILGMGAQDYLTGTGAIEPGLVLVEWAERFSQMWPKDRMEIRIRIRPKSEDREITLTARGERYKEIIGKMK